MNLQMKTMNTGTMLHILTTDTETQRSKDLGDFVSPYLRVEFSTAQLEAVMAREARADPIDHESDNEESDNGSDDEKIEDFKYSGDADSG
jgi:hypothetical protein